jgi:hypothetical protein
LMRIKAFLMESAQEIRLRALPGAISTSP